MVQVRTPIRSNAGGCPKSGKRLFFFLFSTGVCSTECGVRSAPYGVWCAYGVQSTEYCLRNFG